jgi:hypothetical protein
MCTYFLNFSFRPRMKTFIAFFGFLLLFGCSNKTIEKPATGPRIPMDAPGFVNVRDYGATGKPGTDDTQAFNLAMKAADSLHKAVYIPIGIYEADLVLTADNLKIIGEKQPDEMLAGGTVIKGKINCNRKKNITIENLAVDSQGELGPADAAAVFSGDGADTLVLNQTFRNLTIIGDGYTSYKHGMLCQVGTGITMRNIIVVNFYHGIAIRSGNVSVDTVYSLNCGFTAIVVKSADGANRLTENVSLNHISIDGNPNDPYSRGGIVLVQSFDPVSITRNVRVQNVTSKNGGIGCVVVEQRNGMVDQVLIENCNSNNQGDIATRACYDVAGGSNITFRNCAATNSRGFGFRSMGDVSNVRVENSYEHHSGAGSWTGTFRYLQLNGVEIIK